MIFQICVGKYFALMWNFLITWIPNDWILPMKICRTIADVITLLEFFNLILVSVAIISSEVSSVLSSESLYSSASSLCVESASTFVLQGTGLKFVPFWETLPL